MVNYISKETKVVNVDGEFINLDIDGGDWSWSAEWLEPIEEAAETTIIGVGDTVYRSNGTGDAWQPTMKLRWKRFNVNHILQQFWSNSKGEGEWRDIEIVD